MGYEHFDVSNSLTVKEVQALFNKYFEENNMDAKCVTSINYPLDYPSLVIEYVLETNTITGPQIVEFAEKKSIDRTLFTVAPIENGVPMIRSDVDVNVHGDANCDGKTTVADSVAILQHIANRDKYGLKAQGLINADVDGEAGVTANDARVLQEELSSILPKQYQNSLNGIRCIFKQRTDITFRVVSVLFRAEFADGCKTEQRLCPWHGDYLCPESERKTISVSEQS